MSERLWGRKDTDGGECINKRTVGQEDGKGGERRVSESREAISSGAVSDPCRGCYGHDFLFSGFGDSKILLL
jgi:hypothetical protein